MTCRCTYKGNARFPDGPVVPSSLVTPEISKKANENIHYSNCTEENGFCYLH